MSRHLERWAAISGLVTVILIIVSFVIGGAPPDPTASLKDILSYFSDHHNGIVAGGVIGLITIPTFLLFAGGLRARLGRGGAEGATSLGFVTASAATVVAAVVVNTVILGALALRIADQGDDHTVRALYELFLLSLAGFAITGGAFLLAGAVGILATRALPLWSGWLGALLGLVSVVVACIMVANDKVSGLGIAGLIAFLIWLVVVSLLQLRPAAEA